MRNFNKKDMKLIQIEEGKWNLLIEEELTKNIKYSNFNDENNTIIGISIEVKLKDFFSNMIVVTYARVKYSKSDDEKAYYANYLVRLMASFFDLYAQSLNYFYTLGLEQMTKSYNHAFNFNQQGVISETIQGVKKSKGSVVTLRKVIKKLDDDYQSNTYFDNIKNTIDKEMIKDVLSDLRNYETHLQSLFGKYNLFYKPESMLRIVGAGANDNYIDKDEYSSFLDVSKEIMINQIYLINQFKQMYTDKRLVSKNEKEKKYVSVLKCDICGQYHNYPESITQLFIEKEYSLKCQKDDCNGLLNVDLLKREEVHPEKEAQIAMELLKIKLENLIVVK